MKIIIVIASILFFSSCVGINHNEKDVILKSSSSEEFENFDQFFREFYSDTTFQKNRIITPL